MCRRGKRGGDDPRKEKQSDDFVGVTGKDEAEDEFQEARGEASKLREAYAEKDPEDLFQDWDEEGFEGDNFDEDIEPSPERVTDDELFREEDFEIIQGSGDGDGKF